MLYYDYLIVGGGMAADACVRGIREVDASGSIGLISAEPDPPYDRPPLSKGLWKQKEFEDIWRKTDSQGVTMHLGRRASDLRPQSREVFDNHGDVYSYNKLLLATGGTPHRLSFGDEEIIYYRTLADYKRLRGMLSRVRTVAVIGGGFIGSEMAAALAMNGKKVNLIFPSEGICSRIFPKDLSLFLNDYYQAKGVELRTREEVLGCERHNGVNILTTRHTKTGAERTIEADAVIAGLGIAPNVQLASEAGLRVDNGILVDASLRTSAEDIFAAGDVANFYNPSLDQRLRVEHEDNANVMGRLAGQAMAGREVSYDYLPYFYSDLFDLGFEAVGVLDAELETVADWTEPYKKGAIYYLREDRLKGVLLWNEWDQVDAARQLIEDGRQTGANLLLGSIAK